MPKLSFDLLQQEIDYVIATDDIQGAFECYNLVKAWLERSGLAKSKPQEYARYYDYVIKLKFLSLNYFEDVHDYYDLLKNYFSLAQEMKDFDLWEKINVQLVAMRNLDARDVFKSKLQDALEKSDNLLISRQKYTGVTGLPNKISEWVKDFIANLGSDTFDTLKKMEYISNSKYIKVLSEDDKNKVVALLGIYEKLRISSRTPRGYENTVVISIDGKNFIFDHGEISEVTKETLKQIQDIKDASRPSNVLENQMEPLGKPAISSAEPIRELSPLADLEQALKNYPPDSLEHKAIKQEINRLKVAAFKQAQKTNVKK